MRKMITILICLCLVLSMAPAAFAEETTAPVETTEATESVRAEDQCGEDLFWKFADGTLTISGSGAMDDFVGGAPWAEHKNEIEKLELIGVTYIGAESFRDYDKLKEIAFGYHIREIGTRAFYGCDGLETISLPMSFKIFGEESFRACTNLEEIHCDGGFPSFRLNCMWESYVTIYFPADRPWPVSLVQELEEAFHGRIEFIASDGTDPYVPTEPETEPAATEAPTEAPTEVPTEAPTQAPTTIPTIPVTEATFPQPEETIPVTEGAEPVETQAPTMAPTEPDREMEETERSVMKLVISGIAVAVVMTVIIVLLLIFRRAGRKGKFEY